MLSDPLQGGREGERADRAEVDSHVQGIASEIEQVSCAIEELASWR